MASQARPAGWRSDRLRHGGRIEFLALVHTLYFVRQLQHERQGLAERRTISPALPHFRIPAPRSAESGMRHTCFLSCSCHFNGDFPSPTSRSPVRRSTHGCTPLKLLRKAGPCGSPTQLPSNVVLPASASPSRWDSCAKHECATHANLLPASANALSFHACWRCRQNSSLATGPFLLWTLRRDCSSFISFATCSVNRPGLLGQLLRPRRAPARGRSNFGHSRRAHLAAGCP